MRPHPYRPDGYTVAFFDWRRGEGVTDDGQALKAAPRSAPRPSELLAMAAATGARRVFLVGPPLQSSDWLDESPGAGWIAGGHFRELRDPCGRWSTAAGTSVEVRRVASWFGEGDYTAADAREAMALVHAMLQRSTGNRVAVRSSPAATGQSLWAFTVGDGRCDEQLETGIADLIRSTSPQHRQELFGACKAGCDEHLPMPREEVPELFYFDAQFMYGACCRELGAAPSAFLDQPRVAQSFWDGYPYARARYRLTFTVPDGWTGPGLLPVELTDRAPGDSLKWHYPNRPGVECETWADAAECALAARSGWPMRMLSVLKFKETRRDETKGKDVALRPVDKFSDRIIQLRADADEEGSPLAAAAFRSMFIRTIGGWHSRGRERSYLIPAGVELPADVTEWETRDDGSRVFRRRVELTGNAAAFIRPELSAQVWARARARVAGRMLDVDPAQLVGVWGDALYLTRDPGWTAERAGDFRNKGHLAGPLARPITLAELLRYRRQMEGAA